MRTARISSVGRHCRLSRRAGTRMKASYRWVRCFHSTRPVPMPSRSVPWPMPSCHTFQFPVTRIIRANHLNTSMMILLNAFVQYQSRCIRYKSNIFYYLSELISYYLDFVLLSAQLNILFKLSKD